MKKILVVVDYQKDFVDGALGFEKAKSLEEGIFNKVKKYLNEGNKVVFTYDTHDMEYLNSREGKALPIPHCIVNTEGHKLYGKLEEFESAENTIHVNKYGFAMSTNEVIELVEKVGNDIEHIEVVGVVTNMCVISNVIVLQGQYQNADIVVDSSLCASFDDVLHEKALDVIEALQVKVINRK